MPAFLEDPHVKEHTIAMKLFAECQLTLDSELKFI